MDQNLDRCPKPTAGQASEKIYGPHNAKTYIGADAREDGFRQSRQLSNPALATHGILNDRSPMYSHLLLAQTGNG